MKGVLVAGPLRRLGSITLLAFACVSLASCGSGTPPAQVEIEGDTGPSVDEGRGGANVVVVMTDDQDFRSLGVMSKVKRTLAQNGVSFTNSFANLPLCCPSRATFLTGQYAHNHGVTENLPPKGGFEALDSSNTLPVWLSDAGYLTAHVGRYLNHYGVKNPPDNYPELIPPGWREWYGIPHSSAFHYFNFTLNENGRLVHYVPSQRNYQADVFTRKAVSYIRRAAPREKPFFLSVGYLAPHAGGPHGPGYCGGGNAKPAPRHERTFAEREFHASPSFNERNVSDKPRFVRQRPLLRRERIRVIEERYRCRLESLLAVDDGVARIVRALEEVGELERTYVIFTSDNGLFQGEHRRKGRKRYAYEEVSRLPLVIRGPGIPRGETSQDLVINADLAPTVLEAMGAPAGLPMDGTSLLDSAGHPGRQIGRALLIESPGEYAAIRTHRYKFVHHATGERELYDLRRDPHELESRAGEDPYRRVEQTLVRQLAALRKCSSANCRELPRLQLELDYLRGRGGCARGPVTARLAGPSALEVRSVRLQVGGRAARTLSIQPSRTMLGRLPLGAQRVLQVSAVADLLDGRRVQLRESVMACQETSR